MLTSFLLRTLALAPLLSAAYDGHATTLGPDDDAGNNATLGTCQLMKTLRNAVRFQVSLSAHQWARGANCGRCVQAQCSNCPSPLPITAQVTDRCSNCPAGDIDVSRPMFQALFGAPTGRRPLKWGFVDCPVEATLALCTKPRNTSLYTIFVQPTNTVSGVANMTIDGFKGRLSGKGSYFFKAPMPRNWSDVLINLTATNGEKITASVALRSGRCVTIPHQFQPTAVGSALIQASSSSLDSDDDIVVPTTTPRPVPY
ncbi:hypothetical protein SPRG_09655 [Saprolegnia parasitica CBS 223.65]|uniref:Expansin-like EG45 domain-containing protein n=1 Tax=Saprolegnia parasitica (strain CBS 223.65) TaxID=695850 RepID=A0A067CDD1_SAPPC|nr:hypothetical protein SPRG_09655 [Saprolegnia parasitica CBS 223.65]KDO24822.1 hypothetical protein SPRG_09655 [Saprolegnia parasitica CBS 223.65]|eukprot:XP_012204470.1 hypothetical protein SPRG_09655 [Saprolegnia parasitica CBS 223.65]